MLRHVLLAVLLVCAQSSASHAIVSSTPILQIDGTDVGNSLTFLDGGAPGAISASGADLVFDMEAGFVDDDRLGGGIVFPISPELQFDASFARLVVELTVGVDNTSSIFSVAVLDNDAGANANPGEGELHAYLFSELATLPEGQRHRLTRPLTPPELSVALGGPVDGQVNFDSNGGLAQLQIDSFSGPDDRFQVTIHQVRIEAIPEPATLGVGCACSVMLVAWRRRNAT